jgi:hypothetical protein
LIFQLLPTLLLYHGDAVLYQRFVTTWTALERTRAPESEAEQVLGRRKLSMSYTVYSLGLVLPPLHDLVERINYEGLKLTTIENCRVASQCTA